MTVDKRVNGEETLRLPGSFKRNGKRWRCLRLPDAFDLPDGSGLLMRRSLRSYWYSVVVLGLLLAMFASQPEERSAGRDARDEIRDLARRGRGHRGVLNSRSSLIHMAQLTRRNRKVNETKSKNIDLLGDNLERRVAVSV